MPIPEPFNVDDYMVSFPDTYYEGPWVDAPLIVKASKVGQYFGVVMRQASTCLRADAEIPALLAALAGVDYLAGYHVGRETKAADYKAFMREYFFASYEPHIERIYSDLRCGLLHNLVTLNPWRPSSGSFLLVSAGDNHLAVDGDRVVFSIRTFVAHVYQAWVVFGHRLVMTQPGPLHERFNARFDRLAGCGAFLEKVPD